MGFMGLFPINQREQHVLTHPETLGILALDMEVNGRD